MKFDKNFFKKVTCFDNLTESSNLIGWLCQIFKTNHVFVEIFVKFQTFFKWKYPTANWVTKVGCVFPMPGLFQFCMVQYGVDGHPKDAPHFTITVSDATTPQNIFFVTFSLFFYKYFFNLALKQLHQEKHMHLAWI